MNHTREVEDVNYTKTQIVQAAMTARFGLDSRYEREGGLMPFVGYRQLKAFVNELQKDRQPPANPSLRIAAEWAQRVLASLTNEDSIRSTSVASAYAQVREAELQLRKPYSQGKPSCVRRNIHEQQDQTLSQRMGVFGIDEAFSYLEWFKRDRHLEDERGGR